MNAPALIWPDRPICHGDKPRWQPEGVSWRAPRGDDSGPYAQTFRTCSYCGSMHPEDLLNALRAGASASGSDWKYGWPHKFYIEGIPNPKAGHPHVDYTTCGRPSEQTLAEGGWEQYQDGFNPRTGEPNMSWRKPMPARPCPPTLHAKWYNEHLQDLEPAAFEALAAALEFSARIKFVMRDGKLHYTAPHAGFQA